MKIFLISAVVSFPLTWLTVFIEVEVENKSQLDALHLGFPFHFFVQNLSRYTPLAFPQHFSVGSPWEDPLIAVLWLNFFASWIGIFMVLSMLMILSRWVVVKLWSSRLTKGA